MNAEKVSLVWVLFVGWALVIFGVGCTDDTGNDEQLNIEEEDTYYDAALPPDTGESGSSDADVKPNDTEVDSEVGVEDAGPDEWESHPNWGVCEMDINEDPDYPCESDDALVSQGTCSDDGESFFDGDRCRDIDECDCDGQEPCLVFETKKDCVESCAQAGWCNEPRMPRKSGSLLCPDDRCWGGFGACVDSDQDPADRLEKFTDSSISCYEGPGSDRFHCKRIGETREIDCPEDSWCCQIDATGTYPETVFREMCGLTLLPEVHRLICQMELE